MIVCHYEVQKGGFACGRNPGRRVYGLYQIYGVAEVLCCSTLFGGRGTNSQPIGRLKVEITACEEECFAIVGFHLVDVDGETEREI